VRVDFHCTRPLLAYRTYQKPLGLLRREKLVGSDIASSFGASVSNSVSNDGTEGAKTLKMSGVYGGLTEP
jgi:hypothetical protein